MPLRSFALAFLLAGATLPAPGLATDDALQAISADLVQLRRRVEELERAQQRVADGLSREEISEREPELTSRLKAVEYRALNMLEQARTVEALKGIRAGVSFTTTAQWPSRTRVPPRTDLASREFDSQLNYRGDIYVGLPLEDMGVVENRLFASFRVGQGIGLNDLYTFSKPNANAFRVSSVSPDDSVAILGQAWYQATIPLPFGGFKPHSTQRLELTFGKMDPFVFFDQNAAANDETRQFLNTVFVHNALLDAGGDIGVDANGFAPGFRASYANRANRREPWRLSFGLFGAGRGASYANFFASTLAIVQAETQVQLAAGLPGNYRVYAWRNAAAPRFQGGSERRGGFGLSLDQRAGDAITLFARYGHGTRGSGARFDRALTLGTEIGGSYWHRGGDSIGLAFGWMRTSGAFKALSASADGDANGVPDYGFATSDGEQVAEAYYRFRVNKQFEISPGIQLIGRPGGAPESSLLRIAGVRVQISY